MDYTVHGILQARILEWPAFPFSRGSFQPRDQTQVSCIAGKFFTSWTQGKPRILEWIAYPFSSGSSQPRNQTRVSCIEGESLPTELSGEYGHIIPRGLFSLGIRWTFFLSISITWKFKNKNFQSSSSIRCFRIIRARSWEEGKDIKSPKWFFYLGGSLENKILW